MKPERPQPCRSCRHLATVPETWRSIRARRLTYAQTQTLLFALAAGVPRTAPCGSRGRAHQPQDAPRLENPLELPQSEVLIRYFAKDQRQVSSVEGSVGIWESTSISPGWGYILDATLSSPVHHMVEYLLLDVQNLERAARIQPLGDRQGVVARTGTYLQYLISGLGDEDLT